MAARARAVLALLALALSVPQAAASAVFRVAVRAGRHTAACVLSRRQRTVASLSLVGCKAV